MKTDTIFWNVDTQIDFVEPGGKLYVPGAELLKPVWKNILAFAARKELRMVSTADFHFKGSAELSATPDFISTFPEHCMAGTSGAGYVTETDPVDPVIFDWNKEYFSFEEVLTRRNVVIRKDAFDVFAGNPYTDKIVELLAPETVIVFGVTTNVCVNDAVVGLAGRVKKVYVIEDAIKELPNIPLPFENWKKLGVKLIQSSELSGLMPNA